MSIETTSRVEPGWYADPADPSLVRWWDGRAWTAHVSETAAVALPVWVQPRVSDSAGWWSLAFGFFAFVMFALSLVVPYIRLTIYLPMLGAITLGIIALVRVRLGRSRIRWAPISGIVFSGLTFLSVIIVIALVVSVNLSKAVAVPTPQNQGIYLSQYPDNPEMTSMNLTGYEIQHHLRQHAQPGSWPQSLYADADGRVSFDGVTLGQLEPGEQFAYTASPDGRDFQFKISGRVPGEDVQYDTISKNLVGECYTTDNTCESR